MNSATLAQATLIALTMQNQAFKVAPLSRATHSGMCIDRNITVGETVGLYYNAGGSLQRLGDVPGYSGNYWVDDDNRFYTYDSTNQRLIIKDGLSGETLNDTIDAYGFIVAGTRTCCAYKSSQDEKEWVVILPDGSMTAPIHLLSGRNKTPTIGFRNGIIGICIGTNDWGGIESYTYSATGQYLNTMNKGNELAPDAKLVIPINEYTICYTCDSLSVFINDYLSRLAFASTTSYALHDMWSESGYSVYHQGSSSYWIGADQSYIYVFARHYLSDPDEGISEWTDEYYTGRISIDQYNGVEVLRTEISDSEPYQRFNASTQKGTTVHNISSGGTNNRIMIDLSTMSEIYGDVLSNIPSSPLIRENDGFIWISGLGVYQKTPNGWLMYPTSEYPRNDDNQLLGYAIRNVKIGNEGLAIVLFE